MARKDYHAGEISIISTDVKIEGKITSKGNVRVDGSVVGDILVDGNLTLGETSQITGDVTAMNLILSGELHGKAIASEKIVLEAKSRLTGDIQAKKLVVEEGAFFEGRSSMTFTTEKLFN